MSDVESLKGLLECPSIHTLDLQHNQLEDPDLVEEIFSKMPNLAVLYVQGNPFIAKVKGFRKVLITKCKNLSYINEMPVYDEDRRTAEAWA